MCRRQRMHFGCQWKGHRPIALGIFKYLVLLGFLLIVAYPIFDLFFGVDDLRRPRVLGNGALFGNYLTAVYAYCLTVPMCNLIFYFFIYAVFLENYFAGSRNRKP